MLISAREVDLIYVNKQLDQLYRKWINSSNRDRPSVFREIKKLEKRRDDIKSKL